jgi:Fe/S biogenesis protein NfuA
MLTFTDTARERINHFLKVQEAQGVSALRIAGTKSEQRLWLVKESDRQDTDRIVDAGDFQVYLDPLSANHFDGATVDFVEGVMESGFRVFHPSPTWDDPLAQRMQELLDRVINPGVASHGGVVSLEGVEDDVAIIRFGGGCQGCSSAGVTLRHGIEKIIRENIPEIKAIQDATDHAKGLNPYYSSQDDAESPLQR